MKYKQYRINGPICQMNTHSHFTLRLSKSLDNNVLDKFKISPQLFHFVILITEQSPLYNNSIVFEDYSIVS